MNNDYYFGSGLNSRLKLVGLEEKDNLTSTIKKYVFSYVESPALPPRSSSAQDWWGFYNEQTGNTSLIATQTIGFNGFAYAVGASNREPDAAAMQAGTLNKIVYPTGGYTEFYYEPHYYLGTGYDVVSVEAKCGTVGNTTDLLEETKVFTPPTSGWVTVHTYCSNVTDAEPFFSRVFLRKQGVSDYLIEHYYTPYDYSPYEPHLYKDFTVYLESGATYELKVMSKGTSESPQFNYAAFSQASLSYQQEVPNATLMAGGLRVNEIRDYESPSARPVTRIFKYGVGETGTGILLIPQYGISNAKQEIDVEWYQATCGNEYPNACCSSPSCFAKRLMISGTAALDLTSLNGAPVVYDEVTVYENGVASANGRSVHKFDVQEDEFTYADKAYNNGHWQVDNTWKGGDEIWSASYIENSTAMTEENSAGYAVYGIQQTIGTKIGYRVQTEGCSPSNQTESVLFSRLYYFDVPFYSGIRKLISSRERRHSSTDPSKYVETLTTYEYDDLASNHQQLSRKIVLSSAGGNYSSHYWYAADYDASVDNIQSLLNSHIIGTPIKEEIHRDGKLVEGKVTHLNELGRPIELYRYESSTAAAAPAHDRTVLVPSGYVKKYDITYDPETKNVASTIPMDDVTTSFLWGYNNRLPVAEITNADVSSVIYTSFEENGVENTGAKTGSKVWSGVFTLPLPSSAGQYNLFYWKRTGTGAWEPVTQSLAVTAPNETINIGMAGSIIDEVRVAPPGAQMTTYTYDLLKGITSKTDVNNVTSYFRYDAAGRLASMVDDNGNTLKTFSYHYKGQ